MSRRRPKRFWLVRKFMRDGYLKLHEAATVESAKRFKRRFYPTLKCRVVEAK